MSGSQSTLLDLLREQSPARQVLEAPEIDLGLAELEPFPFLAVVGQDEMKLALLLAVINPLVGGVLLIGARGTAKTTAVRSLTDLLPHHLRSMCPQGCTEELIQNYGMEAVCLDCAKRFGYGEPLTAEDRVRIVDLPLNARLEDVVGGINERIALEQGRLRLERGILAQADGNILYIDEVNLLDDAVADAILDAAAQGFYTVRRGAQNFRYRSRFLLIGSMNPEEGQLRPQIMDRLGLRAIVRGLSDPELRFRVYQQAVMYRNDPEGMAVAYASQTMALAEEVEEARRRLPRVTIGDDARDLGLSLIQSLAIGSNRAEITLFEAARAHAAADERPEVEPSDIEAVALLALRQRQNTTLDAFFANQTDEDGRLLDIIDSRRSPKKKAGKAENQDPEQAIKA